MPRRYTIEELRDELASTQAMIDQACAQLDNTHLLTAEQASELRRDLAVYQALLNNTKSVADEIFPKK
jgi:hypothetical protein